MRVNVYSQELADEVQAVVKSGTNRDGQVEDFHAVRLFLESSPLLHDEPDDDDRSAVTFWLPRTAERRGTFARTLRRLANLVDGNQTSDPVDENTHDGYHSFKELYDHRIALFIALMYERTEISWRSKLHHDGSGMPGWFIAGMDLPTGPISYHLPESDWSKLDDIRTLDRAPEWDGHTPADVVQRLTDYAAWEGV